MWDTPPESGGPAHRTGDRIGLDFRPHMSRGIQISTSLHDADHGPLRERPAPTTTGTAVVCERGGFSRSFQCNSLGDRRATHIFLTLQSRRHVDSFDRQLWLPLNQDPRSSQVSTGLMDRRTHDLVQIGPASTEERTGHR